MRSMTSDELDECGLFVDDSQSSEFYGKSDAIGNEDGFHIELFYKKHDSERDGPEFIVGINTGTSWDCVAAESLVEAYEIMGKFATVVTAQLLTEVVQFPKQFNHAGGLTVYRPDDSFPGKG